jgi:hypothetical protein
MTSTLRFGSTGNDVECLQKTLNDCLKSTVALVPDGIFGSKTDMRVREYQRENKLSADGIVGPNTWAGLKDVFDQLVALVPNPQSEDLAAETIVRVAQTALACFGWTGRFKPNPQSPKIAAAKCANPKDPARPRQGAMSLQSIFHIGGAPAKNMGNIPSISADAVRIWQQESLVATNWRNTNDLPAWCGIFCYYVYRCSGLHLNGGWVDHSSNIWGKPKPRLFRMINDWKDARPGCIGCVDGRGRAGGSNHHFIVTNIEPNGTVHSIDGNTFGPSGFRQDGKLSTVARRTYTRRELERNNEEAYFLFPDLKKIAEQV